jgi:hypothetical protein
MEMLDVTREPPLMFSAAVTIVRQSSNFQLAAGLLQEGLGSRGMSSHIPLVCALSIRDAVICLVDESLSICKNRVSMRIDIERLWYR